MHVIIGKDCSRKIKTEASIGYTNVRYMYKGQSGVANICTCTKANLIELPPSPPPQKKKDTNLMRYYTNVYIHL